jgi:hypothetical protein
MTNLAFSSALQGDGGTAIGIEIGKKTITAGYTSSGSLIRLRIAQDAKYGGFLTKKEHKLLQTVYEQLESSWQNPSDIAIKLLKSMDTILTMAPPGQSIDLMQRPLPEEESLITSQAISMMCQERGKCGYAFYSDKKGAHSVKAVVGDPASKCLGRCGSGCSGTSNNKRVYTQECLNHDICIGIVGTGYLGNKLYGKKNQCKDEFNAAIASYSRGESCSHFLQGKWTVVTTYRPRKAKKVKSTYSWYIADLPYYQSPEITSQALQESTGAGCNRAVWYKDPGRKNYFLASTPFASYIDKSIDAYDLKLNGNVYAPQYGNGTWTAKHTSIVVGDNLQCNY